MSYILDALRKADAQRERDPARGIHAHPAAIGAPSAPGARAPWAWGAAALALVAIGAFAWYSTREKASDAVQVAQVTQVAPPARQAAPVNVAPAAVTTPAPAAAIEPPPPAPVAQVPADPPPVANAAPAPAAAGLPADAPRVAISGGVYSTSPAQRMLIVNGQVLNEGSEAAPGVVIEEIKPRTAVLKFRGARYTVAY